MTTLTTSDYSPSATWNQFLQSLSWNQDTLTDSAYRAFKEAIRRDLPRSNVFCDVAEAIHRKYLVVKWGVLNWNWKLALQDSNPNNKAAPLSPTPKTPPPQSFHRSLPAVNGMALADHHSQHNGTEPHNGNGHHNGTNGAKCQQRRPASLASYYS
jgi:hypothetical protein